MTSLSEVAQFVRGVTFKPADVIGDQSGVICLRTKNIQTELDLRDVIRIPAGLVKRNEQFVRHGDLAISSANSWNMVGKASWVHQPAEPMAIGGFISVLRVSSQELDARYLYRWFTSDRVQRKVRSFGQQTTNISNLNFERCLALDIPLPPLPEQRRIAEILDRADELRAKRRRALTLLDEFAESSFTSMFGHLSVRVDSPWSRKLGQVAAIGSGSTPDRKQPHFFGGGIPWVKTTEVRGEVIRHTEESVSAEGQKSARLRVFPAGSIIIAMYGQGKTRGQSAILGIDATVNQACAVVRPSTNFLVEFMAQQLSLLYEQLRAMAQGGNQANLNLGLVADLEVLVPPISEQQQFVELIRRVQNLRSRHVLALAKLDELFASLQQRAFSGDL
ncbi:MAG: restriction modification system specificity domain protein [Glaciihabitans sp.]|nr:restriction modification system specificity domain protein [Glaciihabitans sp.]